MEFLCLGDGDNQVETVGGKEVGRFGEMDG